MGDTGDASPVGRGREGEGPTSKGDRREERGNEKGREENSHPKQGE